ncbi:MAG: sensor histidine kinase [Acidimicrobiales bacterium]
MQQETDGPEGPGVRVQLRFGGKDRVIALPDRWAVEARRLARAAWREPFQRRTWNELGFFLVSGFLGFVGLGLVGAGMALGVLLFVTFVGAVVMAASLRAARGVGGLHRALARGLLGERIEEPAPFAARPGFLGWLQSAFRDRVAWRAAAYAVLKLPLVIAGGWFALSVWVDAVLCVAYPLWGAGGSQPKEFGLVRAVFPPGYLSVGSGGFAHGLAIVVSGLLLVLLAPWPMRLVVAVDRRLMQILLSPDPVAQRLRLLEHARTQTVDESAATLRRIERDLHDGTQAQLVAVAMRLGQAKEKLADRGQPDLDQIRRLVDDAHRGAKEAIVDLRDLARGIHPPSLDTGLEGALATLASRSPVPTELAVTLGDRPTPAIEAIAYFCAAELLANVAQHGRASRASVTCTQHGQWLRLVVRDDGVGGARPSLFGSSSSGLTGLTERVRAVDGQLAIVSPDGGPTVVTVDLPLRA